MDYEYKSIFVGGAIEAQGISSRLDTAGIKDLVKSHGDSARLAGFATAVPGETEVFVRNTDSDRTKAILQDIS